MHYFRIKKTLIIILSILSTVTLYSQKTIVFCKEKEHGFKLKNIKIYQESYAEHNTVRFKYASDSLSIITKVNSDTLIIELVGHIPYILYGISEIKSDTIRLQGFKFYQYEPKDTVIETLERKKLFSKDYRKKEDIYIYNNSFKLDSLPAKTSIIVNDKLIYTSIIKEKMSLVDIGCKPGKFSHSIVIKGVWAKYKCKIE